MLERDVALAEAIAVISGHLDREHPWRLDALCREPAYSTEGFYPGRGESVEATRSVCVRCPVASECTDYALHIGTKYGIWGGLSERERRRLRAILREAA